MQNYRFDPLPKLEGVGLSGYGGGSTDSEILNNLIDDGNLQID